MRGEKWIDWAPHWAPTVKGRYTQRVWDAEDRVFEPQKVEGRCTACGDTFQRPCDSGRVREHISRFAAMHVHGEAPGERKVNP